MGSSDWLELADMEEFTQYNLFIRKASDLSSKMCLDRVLSCGRSKYVFLFPSRWNSLFFSIVTGMMDSLSAMGTISVVVMSLDEQWVEVVFVGTNILTTVADSLVICSRSSSPLMSSCSIIEFIAGMKWALMISVASRVIGLENFQKPVFDCVSFTMLLDLFGGSVFAKA